MRLFLLSILAIGGVHSLTIGYPYRSALFAYSPGRGEFPVQSTEVQGYLRYFDNNGVEHLVSYSHPEPTLGVRQVPGVGNPVVRAYNVDVATYSKAIEGHFRAWIAVQYKALSDEINALKSQGKQPSADMLLRLQPLEKIYQTADFATIAGLPEVKRLFDEHSRIYKVRTEFLQYPTGELKTYTTSTYVAQAPVGETPEQKQAREEHFRIYNEQVAYLRQLEAQRDESISKAQPEAQVSPIEFVTSNSRQEPINRLAGQDEGITEVERATQEHLRLWNEAKLRTEEAISQQQFRVWILEQYKNLKDEIDALKLKGQEPSADVLNRLQLLEKVNQTQDFVTIGELPGVRRLFDEFSSIYKVKIEFPQETKGEIKSLVPQETAEQKQAREEHLRIYNEQVARLRQLETQREEAEKEPAAQIDQAKTVDQQPLRTTEAITEVERATREHLRLWNEAKLNAEQGTLQSQGIAADSNLKSLERQDTKQVIHDTVQVVQEPAEVVKARAEHLRLVEEATQVHKELQAEQQPNFELKSSIPVDVLAKEQVSHVAKDAEVKQQPNFGSRSIVPSNQQQVAQNGVVDTPEVVRAREDHQRFVNEATLRAQNANAQEQVSQLKKEAYEAQSKSELKTYVPSVPQQIVVDTPEVVRAREEHLRLVSEAKLRAQSVEQEELKYKNFDDKPLLTNIHSSQQHTSTLDSPAAGKARLVNQPQQNGQSIPQHDQFQTAETPEVTKARQEHLRIFNAIKSHAEQEQAKILEIKSSGIELKSQPSDQDLEKIQEQQQLMEEARILELERMREVARLQEEQNRLELEQAREAERLAQEQRQMEAELTRLKVEEDQRLVMEKLIEARLLKEEQDQAQQLIITEEYKPMEGEAQQALFRSNPFLNDFASNSQPIPQQLSQQTPIQQQQQQQQQLGSNLQLMYASNPFLQIATTTEAQSLQQQPQSQYQQPQQIQQIAVDFPAESRKIQSSQNSLGTKQQHIKQDIPKGGLFDHASYQPADTAAVLIHLEKARQEHFRAHEQVLEQLRLARAQSSPLKDCD